jgi:hypothetical protein
MVLPSQSLWNNGMVEQWNFEYSVAKADYGPILFSEPCHSDKNRYHSAKPIIPSLQYSIIPRHKNTAQPIFSDLVQSTIISVLE